MASELSFSDSYLTKEFILLSSWDFWVERCTLVLPGRGWALGLKGLNVMPWPAPWELWGTVFHQHTAHDDPSVLWDGGRFLHSSLPLFPSPPQNSFHVVFLPMVSSRQSRLILECTSKHLQLLPIPTSKATCTFVGICYSWSPLPGTDKCASLLGWPWQSPHTGGLDPEMLCLRVLETRGPRLGRLQGWGGSSPRLGDGHLLPASLHLACPLSTLSLSLLSTRGHQETFWEAQW